MASWRVLAVKFDGKMLADRAAPLTRQLRASADVIRVKAAKGCAMVSILVREGGQNGNRFAE